MSAEIQKKRLSREAEKETASAYHEKGSAAKSAIAPSASRQRFPCAAEVLIWLLAALLFAALVYPSTWLFSQFHATMFTAARRGRLAVTLASLLALSPLLVFRRILSEKTDWWPGSNKPTGRPAVESERLPDYRVKRLLLFIHFSCAPVLCGVGYYFFIEQLAWPTVPVIALLAFGLLLSEWFISYLPPAIDFYLFFGVLTTVVSQTSFNLVNLLAFKSFAGGGGFWWLLPKSISWILAVQFAFLTNRTYVFIGKKEEFWYEMSRFYLARLSSGLLVETLGMFILVNLVHVAEAWANLATAVVVVIVNYVMSKRYVFRGVSP